MAYYVPVRGACCMVRAVILRQQRDRVCDTGQLRRMLAYFRDNFPDNVKDGFGP